MVHYQNNGLGCASGNDDGISSNMSTFEEIDGRISNGEGDDRDDDYGIASYLKLMISDATKGDQAD